MVPETVAIDLLVPCTSCGGPVPVTRPAQSSLCMNCLGQTRVEVWSDVLAGVDQDLVTLGRGVLAEGTVERPGAKAEWKRGPGRPPCPRCGHPLRFSAGQQLACPACGAIRPFDPAPDWLRAANPCVRGTVSDPDDAGAGLPRSISIRCTQCGSPLATDGSKRIVECQFCRTGNVLQDDVWRALHPPKKRRVFWLVCGLAEDPRTVLPAAPNEHISDAVFPPLIGVFIGLTAGTFPMGIAMLFAEEEFTWAWVYGGTIVLAVVIGLLVSVHKLTVGFKLSRRHQRVVCPQHEVVGQLGPWVVTGLIPVSLVHPADPSRVLVAAELQLTAERYGQLGGAGAFVRAWYAPATGEHWILDAPTGLIP